MFHISLLQGEWVLKIHSLNSDSFNFDILFDRQNISKYIANYISSNTKKARNFHGMKFSRFHGCNLKSAKLKCHEKYFFSST